MCVHKTREMKHVDEAHMREKSLDQFKTDHFAEFKDFERQIELGRNLKILINEEGFNINNLSTDMKEALKAYENYAQNMEEINWRGWQKDLREYLFMPFYRKIVWVVGERGNEGKSFFQRNVLKEFGYSHVSILDLFETERNTYHILGKHCSSSTYSMSQE